MEEDEVVLDGFVKMVAQAAITASLGAVGGLSVAEIDNQQANLAATVNTQP